MPIMFQVVDKFNDATLKTVFRCKQTVTDTAVFRLHYKFTIILVGIYSLFHVYLTINSSISCTGSYKPDVGISKYIKVVEDYCWSAGTFSVRKAGDSNDSEFYPGVRPVIGKDDEMIVYHHYYKWMYFFIFVKIVSLYMPHYVWNNIENGLMKELSLKLNPVLIVEENEDTKKQLDNLANFFYNHLGSHQKYASGLVYGEILNVVVVSILLFLWDFLTGHELSRRAPSTTWSDLNKPGALRNDRLTEIFPVIGKCTFTEFGPSGSPQIHDFLCVLPINVVNERAAVFFWYYFMVLVVVGSIQVVFRAMLIMSKRLRAWLLSSLTPITTQDDIDLIVERCSYSDWFVLNQFGLNVEPIVFRKLLQRFVLKLKTKRN